MLSASPLLALALLLAPAPDSWVQPTKTTLSSPDGRWSVTVTPGKCTACGPHFTGDHTAPHATAVATVPDGTVPDGTVRTFELLHPSMPVGLHLTDRGDLYCFDHWGQMGYGRCLARYDAHGALVWARTLEELLPADRMGEIQPTVSSRNWLRHPLHLVETDDWLAVSLFNSDRLRVERTTGAATYEEIDEFGDDARGWFLKALALEQRGDLDAASVRLDRAVDLDLSLVTGYARIAYRQHLAQRDAKGIALLEAALERTLEAPWTEQTGPDPRRALRFDLATAYLRAELPGQAEPILRALVSEDPTFEAPEVALIGLLFRDGRAAQADELVERGYQRRLRDDRRSPLPDQRHVDAVMSAAYLCQSAGESERAAGWYRRGIEAGAWNENLGLAFVTLLDQHLGELDEALQVLTRVVDDMRAARRTEHDVERREWWDRRLKDFEGRLKDLRRRSRGG